MIKKVKPGELIWCAEGGDVKRVEVTLFQRDDFPNKTRIKYPNDNVTNPWYCWNGYLFKTKKAAIKAAIRQTQLQMVEETVSIVLAKQHLSELEQQEKQLKSELEETT